MVVNGILTLKIETISLVLYRQGGRCGSSTY